MTAKRLLVTGLEGFVGGTVRRLVGGPSLRDRFELVIPSNVLELRDRNSLAAAVTETRPDCVLHLAGQSFVPASIKDPLTTYVVNFLGTLNLLDALNNCGFNGRFLYVSSGDVYGRVSLEDLPVTEKNLVQPRNPYAVSKAAAELLCVQWKLTHDFDIVIARPFNHIGAGQSEWFVISDFAKQVIEVKLGRRAPEIHVGSIDVTRDFTDVRDVVHAYLLLLEFGQSSEIYNVCSEHEQSIRSMLDELLKLSGIECSIIEEAARKRPNEQTRMFGSYAKLQRQVGWQPMISTKQSLLEVLNFWESKLKNG